MQVPLIQDVVDTHPGLLFLKEATEFHSRFVHTVSAALHCTARLAVMHGQCLLFSNSRSPSPAQTQPAPALLCYF